MRTVALGLLTLVELIDTLIVLAAQWGLPIFAIVTAAMNPGTEEIVNAVLSPLYATIIAGVLAKWVLPLVLLPIRAVLMWIAHDPFEEQRNADMLRIRDEVVADGGDAEEFRRRLAIADRRRPIEGEGHWLEDDPDEWR